MGEGSLKVVLGSVSCGGRSTICAVMRLSGYSPSVLSSREERNWSKFFG